MSNPLAELAISETGFIFDPRTGATFNVNATGLITLTALRDGASAADPAAIAELIRARFPSAPADVGEHVTEFIRTLRQLGLAPPPEIARDMPRAAPPGQGTAVQTGETGSAR